MEKGAERLFLCLDKEYRKKTKNEKPNINSKEDKNPIMPVPPSQFQCLRLLLPMFAAYQLQSVIPGHKR